MPTYTLHKRPASVSLMHGLLLAPEAMDRRDVRLNEAAKGDNCGVMGHGTIVLLIALEFLIQLELRS